MMNSAMFLGGQSTYFSGSYDQFREFGGPCVYFHLECLRAGREGFLSHRHIEMLYATLTAWGMHRMGGTETTKTKLVKWEHFQNSLAAAAPVLAEFRACNQLGMSETEYSEAILRLRAPYESLKLSESDATIVVNSKALYHLLPDFIPPIDRQYTIRFFKQAPDAWRDSKGKFRVISLPSGMDAQFKLFHTTCVELKRLADRVDPALFEAELRRNGVSAPKALDNAIVNYVRTISTPRPSATREAAPIVSD
ncbi:MAG: hypothetical protein WA192_09990 [Candidatus Acidiferrales bacterium]